MRVYVDVVVDIDRRGESLVVSQHLALLYHGRVPDPNQLRG